jgi:hypothetical protein
MHALDRGANRGIDERKQVTVVSRGDAEGGRMVADEPVVTPHIQTDPVRASSNRGMLELLGIILVVVVVALLLLMFHGFDAGKSQNAVSSGGKRIVPVAGLTADPGVVSAWVTDGSDIAAALHVAGLENSKVTDMGGGRYVISVPIGTEETVVRILSDTPSVHDAGLVYDLKE